MMLNFAPPRRPLLDGPAWAILGLALLVAPRAVSAQPSPLSVNDCTLLPDPGALRRCLDQAEGRVVGPLPPISAPAAVGRPGGTAQTTDGAPAKRPAAEQHSDFLSERSTRGRQISPASRNVIDLQ